MGKYDLQLASRRRGDTVVPTVVDSAPGFPQSDNSLLLKKELISGSIEIAKMVVGAGSDIAHIRENADAEVRKIAADIDRIAADTEAFVKRTRAESAAWHTRFDKESAERREIVGRIMSSLDAHPEWSDAIKEKVIDLALSAVSSK